MASSYSAYGARARASSSKVTATDTRRSASSGSRTSRPTRPRASSAAARAGPARGARATCQTQGDAGQWWWHYDYRTGRLLEGYPVYAVHQDSMAPMALFAAARVAGRHFDDAIGIGLDWLCAAPEL